MNFPNREAVEFNSRGQRPRSAREPGKGRIPLLFDPFRVGLFVGSRSGGVATGY